MLVTSHRGLPRLLVSLAWCLATASVAASVDPIVAVPLATDGFVLKVPDSAQVRFQGMLDPDRLGGAAGTMAYPSVGGGLVGALAAVATHAVIVNSSNSSRRSEAQVVADRVLDPYKASVAEVTHDALLQAATAPLAVPGIRRQTTDLPAGGWLVHSAPVFSMSLGANALVLENELTVRSVERPDDIRYQAVIKVVSAPRDPDMDAQAYWSDAQEQRLQRISLAMYTHSLRLLIEAASFEGKLAPQKSVRYVQGDVTKVERGHLIRQQCGRAVLRTLRGGWMSVPLRPAPVPPVAPASAAEPDMVPAPDACGDGGYAL
ncbi:hypothetical protein [Rhizobacter sp. LjRoot28]|uniref:hypothetical protein n=1 Tax=Rhizobacter sp. LjRoot28 TaxID=3342309 RepID=UPI003ECF2314